MKRGPRRRLLFGLQTVLGLARRGFFIPHARADAVAPPGPLEWVETRFEATLPAFMAAMDDIDGLAPALGVIGGAPPPEPRWDQDWFLRLDAAILYALARRRPPRRAVEVGSGHSTRFLLRALRDGGAETDVTAIDPAPRADLAGSEGYLKLLQCTVQEVGRQPFEALETGDWLMIDSSHIAMPGTDVDFLFGHILPGLPSDVLLHVHDIFLPDPYPEEWAWRGYNEQLAAALRSKEPRPSSSARPCHAASPRRPASEPDSPASRSSPDAALIAHPLPPFFADRTSATAMRANQLRLWFASMAYVLLSALRRIALPGTRLARATCGSIRLKLLKIGAQVRLSARRIRIAMASACPHADIFAQAHRRLCS